MTVIYNDLKGTNRKTFLECLIDMKGYFRNIKTNIHLSSTACTCKIQPVLSTFVRMTGRVVSKTMAVNITHLEHKLEVI